MNMKLTENKNIQNQFAELFSHRSENEKLEHNTQMIMFRFLSEIERMADERGFKSRKELADAVGVTPSYLTQLFRGGKKLNLETVAKFQEALNIVFDIKAKESVYELPSISEEQILAYNSVQKLHTLDSVCWLVRVNKKDVYSDKGTTQNSQDYSKSHGLCL